MRPTPLLALLLSFTAPVQALDMLVYPNAGIFDIDDGGRISGPGAVLLDRLRELSGLPLEPTVIPFARALLPESLQAGACLIALTRTPDREARYRWAGPWSSSVIALYGRTGETRKVNGPEDMRGARIAALRAAPTAGWLKERGLDAYEVNNVAAGLRLLQAGRVDYWLGNDVVTRLTLKASGAAMPRLLFSFGRIELYVACHLATPAAIVGRLHGGLAQLRANGELAEFGLR
jgi:polar amino acid transport system substrate-binding protein